jgi:lactate 2-monooxygenase
MVTFDSIALTPSAEKKGAPAVQPQYGDYHWDIYLPGLQGKLPKYPVDYPSLERAAAEVLPSWVYSDVGYGAGDGHTQQANIDAFSRYGIIPRMLAAPTERDLSVSLFDMQLPNPLFTSAVVRGRAVGAGRGGRNL